MRMERFRLERQQSDPSRWGIRLCPSKFRCAQRRCDRGYRESVCGRTGSRKNDKSMCWASKVGVCFWPRRFQSDALVVLEGRALLSDGESVRAKVVSDTAAQRAKESKK